MALRLRSSSAMARRARAAITGRAKRTTATHEAAPAPEMILEVVDGSCGRWDTAHVRVKLFGGVSVDVNGQPLTLGGPKQRGVFALLALHANQTVSLDRLVHELWLDEPPARATL